MILDEALDHNVTLLLGGRADDVAAKTAIKNRSDTTARNTNTSTSRTTIGHQRGLGAGPRRRRIRGDSAAALPRPARDGAGLKGLAILDNDGAGGRTPTRAGSGLSLATVRVWKTIVTPETLSAFAKNHYRDTPLFGDFESDIEEALDAAILGQVFAGRDRDFAVWKPPTKPPAGCCGRPAPSASSSARCGGVLPPLAARLGHAMLLRQGRALPAGGLSAGGTHS